MDLGYGDSLSGKSTALEALSYHLIEKTDKIVRVYAGDGGTESYNRRGLVDRGKIEIMHFIAYPEPLLIVDLISDLFWPKEGKHGAKLIPPPSTLGDTHCLIIYEGGTVMGQYMLDGPKGSFAWHAAHGTGFGGIKGDEQDKLQYVASSEYGEEYNEVGLSNGIHAWRAQQKLIKAIRKSSQFPGMVFWTAHPTVGADKAEGGATNQYGAVTGKSITGPDFGGKAQVGSISKEFNGTFHFDTVWANKKVLDPLTKKDVEHLERQYRMYVNRHRDPEGKVMTEYVAGNRAGKGMPDYFISKEPGDSLNQYYQKVSELRGGMSKGKVG